MSNVVNDTPLSIANIIRSYAISWTQPIVKMDEFNILFIACILGHQQELLLICSYFVNFITCILVYLQ